MTSPAKIPFERLRSVLLPMERVAVALSGGLDSSVLLVAAADILGADRCLALTAETPYVMREELRDSAALCRRLGVRQEKLVFPILPEIAENPPLRCYLCKHALFSALAGRAAELGFPRWRTGPTRTTWATTGRDARLFTNSALSAPFWKRGWARRTYAFWPAP